MRLSDLHHFQRFQEDRKVKVLRHKDSVSDLWELRRRREFTEYQSGQSWDIFGDARYVISFIAERNRYAKFVGVWEVISKTEKKPRGIKYETRELQGFEDLEGRLIILWGGGARSWGQWFHRQGNKEINEILPPDYVMEFPGYYNFTLTYDQLATIVKNPDSNREWQRMLSSISGVYVLLDQRTGKQYVGSAYGAGGIWNRWKAYVASPSGGNVQLKKILETSPSRCRDFQFSIIRVLEPSVTRDEVITQEVLTKKKLGSRAFGVNIN